MDKTFTRSDIFLLHLANGDIDFLHDQFAFIPMGPSFKFIPSIHLYAKNIQSTTGPITYDFDADSGTITRFAGSFIDDGFVVGTTLSSVIFSFVEYPFSDAPPTFQHPLFPQAEIVEVNALTMVVKGYNLFDAFGTSSISGVEDIISSNSAISSRFLLGGTDQSQAIIVSADSIEVNPDIKSVDIKFPDLQWTASDYGIGMASGVICIDKSITGSPIIGYASFYGTESRRPYETLTVSGITIRLI